jgi:succinate-semialdehyde dehydrogenase/glutarate-semialdehyde dehydrogenase
VNYRTLNPATEELIETYPFAADERVESALAASSKAFEAWRRRTLDERAEILQRLATLLEGGAEDLARLMALEMGKPLPGGRAEADKCALGCRHFAEHAAAWQFFRFAAPALMAGNTVLLKHAPGTPRCALAIESMLREAGVPNGTVQSLFLRNEQAARILADSRVRGVTLTGSTEAGREVASIAGRHLRAMVLELGGSDPFIVLDDADLDAAVPWAVTARCQNSGQSCIAAKRFLIHRSRFDDFLERFAEGMAAKVVGDPAEPGVEIGPLARGDLRDRLAEQVEASVTAGARVHCGGRAPERTGFYYPPTVLSGVAPKSPAADEELFGPVASVFPFDSDEEALAIANGTAYGLGASLWTRDLDRARRLLPQIEAGTVFINGMVRSDPKLPFGGIKDSGFGRELGREGILEFVNRKTVWIENA